jgi:aminobenzoyl-glutamate utilization protein B
MNDLSLGAVLSCCMSSSFANELLRYVDRHGEKFDGLALELWDYAELGNLEFPSSTKLQQVLAEDGFEIQAGVAGIPTAFVASFVEEKPVIGILAEFDALPGISQAAVSSRQLLEGKESGHACGHHLFGAGFTAAAIAVRHCMANNKVKGTVRLYGTPAEEGGPVKFI